MRLLLTSAGVANDSIRAALVDLLGRQIEDCVALAVPTAEYGHPAVGPEGPYRFLTGTSGLAMCDLGWRSVGVLELTALPSLDRRRWLPWVEDADVLLVAGGDALYLAHWLRESGVSDLLATWDDKVWVGLSAGSMALTPRIGDFFVKWRSPTGDDRALGYVDFSIFPHLEHPSLPENTTRAAEAWAAGLGHPAYAIDDQTALVVMERGVEVVSEGHWRYFAP